MPWETPALRDVRSLVRDSIRGSLPGADALVPNSVLRVLSDNQGALCHLTLQMQDWLALQLLPDTAETEWLDRHGDIWLVNADGTTGRKAATLAEGSIAVIGVTAGIVIPLATRVEGQDVSFETTLAAQTADGGLPVDVPVRALDPGIVGNLTPGSNLAIPSVEGITGASVIELGGGVEAENDDDLRTRVLERIRQPPQGGATHDYIRWAKAVPGCTRAWCSALEMGIGTVTVRVLFDDLRADDDGWPRLEDIEAVTAYMNTVRPVAVKDFFVTAPIKQFIEVRIGNLSPDNLEVRQGIETSLQEMLFQLASPGQTIFAVWKSQAVMNAPNVISFDLLDWDDDVMESPGHMAVLGNIIYF